MDKPSKEELLAGIYPNMKLTKNFFKRIYGYELSFPGFSEQVIAALEAAGCSKARQYYEDWVKEYGSARDAELREVAKWYREECEKQWQKIIRKGSDGRRIQKEMKPVSKEWMEGLF